jgi:hypothetical protein
MAKSRKSQSLVNINSAPFAQVWSILRSDKYLFYSDPVEKGKLIFKGPKGKFIL